MRTTLGLLTAVLLLAHTRTVDAQACRDIARTVPANASTVEALVPPGARLEVRTDGDLDADGRADVALVLRVGPATREPTLAERVLVVARATATGFETISVAACLLPCAGCGGINDSGQSPVVEIQRGVLAISQTTGSTDRTVETLRFRFDASRTRMLLIGEDAAWFSHDGDSGSTSTNLLLGVQTSTQARTARNGRVTTVTTRERLPRRNLVRMEEIATRE